MTKSAQMDWTAILAEVHRRGMTLQELARREGLSPSSTNKLKSRTNAKAQAAVARFIDRRPEELWPDRYPIRKPRILDTKKYPPVKSQKLTADADTARAA